MNVEQIKALIKAMDESPVSELEYNEGSVRLRIVKQAISAPGNDDVAEILPSASTQRSEAAPVSAADRGRKLVEAPLPGIFYRSASPDEPPFVEPGAKVTQGQTIALIEAMKMLTPIKAGTDGTVSAILVENGMSVEAGKALLEIET